MGANTNNKTKISSGFVWNGSNDNKREGGNEI